MITQDDNSRSITMTR